MLRIYCDWNNGIDEKAFDLACPGSMQDIEKYSDEVRDGMRVVFYEPDEVEAEGTIHFDQGTQRWFGLPDFKTMRRIGRSALESGLNPPS